MVHWQCRYLGSGSVRSDWALAYRQTRKACNQATGIKQGAQIECPRYLLVWRSKKMREELDLSPPPVVPQSLWELIIHQSMFGATRTAPSVTTTPVIISATVAGANMHARCHTVVFPKPFSCQCSATTATVATQ